MLIEKKGKAIRNNIDEIGNDKRYLIDYYKKNNRFPLFSQVLIETRTDCNKRCEFCPQSFFKREKEVMKWEVFTKIIDSLAEIQFAGRIAFLVSNEPLLETRLPEMIDYARRKSSLFFLDITTNGVLLSLKKVEKLFKAGLDNININDYRDDRTKNPDIISDNLVEILEACKSNPKISYKPRSTKEELPNYAGIIPQEFNTHEFGFCNFPFRKLVFSVNGNVLLCCNDFAQKTNMGNLNTDSLLSIWHSEKFNHIRQSLLLEKRISLCSACNDKQSYSIFN